ncbi:Alpha-N-acetylglucosamine transferase [Pyrenophora tritici-repentis]|nr:Alpha-N-acetylglucosamine transferase [Pyrenophora tritici-repentis]
MPRPAHFSKWFALRRVRTASIISALLLVVLSLSHFVTLAPSIPAPPQYTTASSSATTCDDRVQWSDFAYVQYVTNANYLCNSLLILDALYHSKAKADRIIMYPEGWHVAKDNTADDPTKIKLLRKARDVYQAKLVPIQVQSFEKGDATWKDSYTKLLAFNQTQYKRVMSLDSDAIVREHMDELFLLPSSSVVMPRAYWLDQPFLSSQLVLVEPSVKEWRRVQQFMNSDDSGFDMDILNIMFKDSCVVIPHRRYNLLSSEFRSETHQNYLGSDEAWDGTKVLEETKFIHFSDWPVPKPWYQTPESVMKEHQPRCRERKDRGEPDCRDRDIWLNLYKDFSNNRQRICGRSYDK